MHLFQIALLNKYLKKQDSACVDAILGRVERVRVQAA